MSEQGAPQRPRQPPHQANAHDPYWHQPINRPPAWPAPHAPDIKLDPANLYLSITKIAGGILILITTAIYLNNFKHETQDYQREMTRMMSDLSEAMKVVATVRDLSDFCMMAEKENPTWKCPSAFQWRRTGVYYPPTEKGRRNVTTIQLGAR